MTIINYRYFLLFDKNKNIQTIIVGGILAYKKRRRIIWSDQSCISKALPACANRIFPDRWIYKSWYQAPEIILSCPGKYTKAVDIWSVGCILTEMINNRPLFPAECHDFYEHLKLIFEQLGFPTDDNLNWIKSDTARDYIRDWSLSVKNKRRFSETFLNADPRALDLLERMLSFNPAIRITVEEALAHPYLREFYDPTDDPVAEQQFRFEMNLDELPRDRVKRMIFEEVEEFHRSRPIPHLAGA